MSDSEKPITWTECYNRFREDGFGRISSAWLGYTLYCITQMDHVEGLIDRDKWRDLSREQ